MNSAEGFDRAAKQQREATERALGKKRSPEAALKLFDDTHARLLEGVSQSPRALHRGCRAQCAACCCVPRVDVTPLEALAVAEHLRNGGGGLSAIRTRLADHVARRNAPSPKTRPVASLPCALLGADQKCSAYPVRPLICAGTFSLSRKACDAAASRPQTAGAKIPLDRPAKSWTMGTSMGLQHGLAAVGLDANLYEFDSAVLVALQQANALERWLRGKDVFKHAICNDAHSPPRVERRINRIDRSHATAPAHKVPISLPISGSRTLQL